eukprot:CAMPEP_0206484868 /NCGR_PEP_ID=MMETSP0324_2-20121206/40208_1 /ASSEMBLY_ACC=CAM_ASM_000836 /TAXON_ID=2866 /ORGANISM="Crypthecodinium cohnii, Strain Seligo" /LENGTH=487 /DNA_ID=CAMNT_0053963053 /DNA_START=33 /DNA_END=1497 /DNA_ORIENTATION=-
MVRLLTSIRSLSWPFARQEGRSSQSSNDNDDDDEEGGEEDGEGDQDEEAEGHFRLGSTAYFQVEAHGDDDAFIGPSRWPRRLLWGSVATTLVGMIALATLTMSLFTKSSSNSASLGSGSGMGTDLRFQELSSAMDWTPAKDDMKKGGVFTPQKGVAAAAAGAAARTARSTTKAPKTTTQKRRPLPNSEPCGDPLPFTDCYQNVTWAKSVGIWIHPQWYQGLTRHSSRIEFQEHLFETQAPGGCRKPCPNTPFDGPAGRLALPQVDPACYFEYNGGEGPQKCFCQLAHNRACSHEDCACPQGCNGITWKHANSVTFRNKARASGCARHEALLTIPKSYVSHINALRTWCGSGMTALLQEMLIEGFNSYVEHVGPAPVLQCIHAAQSISVPWLHLHTFCSGGHVDGIGWGVPDHLAWCGDMSKPEDAATLAEKAKDWAVRMMVQCQVALPPVAKKWAAEVTGQSTIARAMPNAASGEIVVQTTRRPAAN